MRTLLTFLLIISFITTGAARTSRPQDETPGTAQEEKLTPEEESEARALIEEFIKRLEETEDVTPLLSDLYIDDFAERLREDAAVEKLFPLAVKREVAAQATPDEIRRMYAASINGSYMAMRLLIAAELKRKQERLKGQENDEEPTIEELLTPALIKLIQSDPVLNAVLEKQQKEETTQRTERGTQDEPAPAQQAESNSDTAESNSDTAANEDSKANDNSGANEDSEADAKRSLEDMYPFKSLEEMRHYTSFAEQGVELLRAHFKSLSPEMKPTLARFYGEMDKESDESGDKESNEKKEKLWPHLCLVEEHSFMGYAVGTRVIRVDAYMFRLDMVRASDGKLKIALANFYMD
jgi:hypothetical protein